MYNETKNIAELLQFYSLMSREKHHPYTGSHVVVSGNSPEAKNAKGMRGFVVVIDDNLGIGYVSIGNDERIVRIPLRNLICL